MSQTTPIHNRAACQGIQKSELINSTNGQPCIRLVCDGSDTCKEKTCSFLCKWFTLKNDYLLKEFGQLKQYLSSLPDLFFRPEIEICVKVIADQEIPNDIFDYLRDYVSGHQWIFSIIKAIFVKQQNACTAQKRRPTMRGPGLVWHLYLTDKT